MGTYYAAKEHMDLGTGRSLCVAMASHELLWLEAPKPRLRVDRHAESLFRNGPHKRKGKKLQLPQQREHMAVLPLNCTRMGGLIPKAPFPGGCLVAQPATYHAPRLTRLVRAYVVATPPSLLEAPVANSERTVKHAREMQASRLISTDGHPSLGRAPQERAPGRVPGAHQRRQ